jgi:hypothetical protein
VGLRFRRKCCHSIWALCFYFFTTNVQTIWHRRDSPDKHLSPIGAMGCHRGLYLGFIVISGSSVLKRKKPAIRARNHADPIPRTSPARRLATIDFKAVSSTPFPARRSWIIASRNKYLMKSTYPCYAYFVHFTHLGS